MGNQQGTPTEIEIAWLAGFIEGEGSLSLSAWNRFDEHAGRNPKIAVTIKIYNTDAALIGRCTDILCKLGISPHLKEREQRPMLKPDGSGEYKSVDPMLVLTVSKLVCARALLEKLVPHLYGNKRRRAAIMMQYLDRRIEKIERNGGNFRNLPYDDAEIELVEAFYKLTRVQESSALRREA